MEAQANEPTWGVNVIGTRSFGVRSPSVPTWVNERLRAKWHTYGVVVWSTEPQHITHLRGDQALRILEQLRVDDGWREHGMTIGEPVVRLQLPDVARKPRRKGQPAQGAPTTEAALSKPKHVLTNTLDLTGEQAQRLFEVLAASEDELRRFAEGERQKEQAVLSKAYTYLFGIARQKEAQAIDRAARPIPWVSTDDGCRWTCDLPPNRVTVTLSAMNFFWQGCLEQPGTSKDHSPYLSKLDDAMAWAEQAIIQAAEEAQQPRVAPPAPRWLSLDTLTTEQRSELEPFWITPRALEPPRLSYRAHIWLNHRHTEAQVLELSFGEKLYYGEKYPTVLQIAQTFRFNADLVDIDAQGMRGTYRVSSRTVYLDRAAAVQEAQRLWEQSTLSSPRWSSVLEGAYFGVQEVETGYYDSVGGVGMWLYETPPREGYMERRALKVTIAHALHIPYWRALKGLDEASIDDERALKGMHACRAASNAIPEAAREESQRWLKEHGVK